MVGGDIVTRIGWLGVSMETLRRRLVAQFLFRESDYTHRRDDPKAKHYSDYKKPTRASLAALVEAEIIRICATRKRPKVLVGAVVKRTYDTYPEEATFQKKMEKIGEAAEVADSPQSWCGRHGKKNRWHQG